MIRRQLNQGPIEFLQWLFDRDELCIAPLPEDLAGMYLRLPTADEVEEDDFRLTASWEAAGTFADRDSREWPLRLFVNAVLGGRYPAPVVLVDLADRLHSYCEREDAKLPIEHFLWRSFGKKPRFHLLAIRDFLYAAFIVRESKVRRRRIYPDIIPAIAGATGYSDWTVKKCWDSLRRYARTLEPNPGDQPQISVSLAIEITRALNEPEARDRYTEADLPKKRLFPDDPFSNP